MSLTLLQSETNARTLTRHDSDTRFSTTQWRVWANEEYRRMRTWLRQEDIAPGFALLTSADQTVAEAASLTLSGISATLEGVFRVDWDESRGSSQFRPLERADILNPNMHGAGVQTFREEAGVLKFGPDGTFAGTVRVLYHNTPASLTADADLFVVPVECERVITLRTCGWIAIRDGEGAAGQQAWEAAAQRVLDEAMPAIKARHGIHPRRAGLHMVMGY